ncbi:hypothetical protein FTUN_6890 [Frigoriglobus tundricola]|uniref:Uncharacterized protein n=1 Tax=Frigoriglobus tundricola TaxID=2774151 RepID=A0A6M5YZI8_9BACT|nr:hypothetical protein FTUN_6890 [Frigoriglobus tundricola]
MFLLRRKIRYRGQLFSKLNDEPFISFHQLQMRDRRQCRGI